MSKLILVADDERDIVGFVSDFLQAEGYETAAAYNGEEAFEAIERLRPDAVVLDIKMPIMDGLEVIRKLRQNPAIAATPVVVFTATQVIQESKERFKEFKVHTWISKPFEPGELLAAVKSSLQSKK